MKKVSLLLPLILLVAVVGVSQDFRHPGALHTQDDFVRMSDMIHAGAEPWTAGWDKLTSSSFAQLSWSPRPAETVIRGGTGDNVALLYKDVAAAYQHALIWKISGDSAHAEKAVEILNVWSSVHKTLTGNADRYLASGLFGYQFANAAELMRDYPGFELARFQNYLLTVFYYPLVERFLVGNEYGADHNDACISNYWANWDLCNMAAMIAIGILCDNQVIYDKGIEYFKNGAGNGSIRHAVPFVHSDLLAQWQEAGRDQGHGILGVGLMASFCEMAWNQGDDLYSWDNNRFRKGAEYIARYNMGMPVPFTKYEWCGNRQQTEVSDKQRGEWRNVWEMIYNHYAYRAGQGDSIQFIAAQAKRHRPEGGPGGHASTFDQPGFGTLTHSLMSNEGVASFIAEADAYVSGSAGSVNYGAGPSMIVTSGSGFKHAFLKFNLSEIQRKNVTSAKLSLTVKSLTAPGSLTLYAVDTDEWTETSLTWDNQPATGSLIGSENVSSVGQILEWDITNLVSADTDGVISLVIKDPENDGPEFELFTKENESDGPVLKMDLANIAPTVEFVSALDLLRSHGDSLQLEAYAFDMDGAASMVEFYLDGTKVGEDSVAPFASVVKDLIQGSYTVTAVVTDDAGATATSVPARLTVNDAIVGSPNVHYTFDSTAVDVTGGGKDAVLENGTEYFSEEVTTSASLDGVDDHVSMPEGILSSLEDFTICARVYLNENRGWARIFDFGASTSENMFLTSSADGSNQMKYTIKNEEGRHDVQATSQFPVAAWTHVAVTYSGNTITLYQNGVVVGSQSGVQIRPADLGLTNQNYIGRSLWSADPYLHGMVDDFRIYDRALSGSQLKRVMSLSTRENQSPFVYLSSPAEGATFMEDSSIVITTAAEDIDGDIVSVSYYHDGLLLGTLSTPTDMYTFTWTGAAPGDYVLSAVAMDDDGASTTSGVINVTVEEKVILSMGKAADPVIMYPNPVNNVLHVATYELVPEMKTRILDMAGKEILSVKMVKQQVNFDLTDIPNGLYLVEIGSNSRIIARQKLVKN